jgi:hypothetical protein
MKLSALGEKVSLPIRRLRRSDLCLALRIPLFKTTILDESMRIPAGYAPDLGGSLRVTHTSPGSAHDPKIRINSVNHRVMPNICADLTTRLSGARSPQHRAVALYRHVTHSMAQRRHPARPLEPLVRFELPLLVPDHLWSGCAAQSTFASAHTPSLSRPA